MTSDDLAAVAANAPTGGGMRAFVDDLHAGGLSPGKVITEVMPAAHQVNRARGLLRYSRRGKLTGGLAAESIW